MASEWKEIPLGEAITLQRGFDLPTQERKVGNTPVVSSSGISGYHDEARVKAPGVVTGRYGTIGEVFLVREDFWPLNTTLYVKDFKGNDERFISYLLRTLNFLSHNDKSSVPGVNRNHLHLIPVSMPKSVEEQRAIAHILGTLDDKIELNRRRNETLEAMARALFQSWFLDFDPVRAKAAVRRVHPRWTDAEVCRAALPTLAPEIAALFPDSFENSALGDIPIGWQIERFGEVCERIFSGGTPSTTVSDYWHGGLPWLSSGETRAKFVISTEKSISQKGVENSSTRFARTGSTVIASAGQGNTRGQTSLLMLDTYINQSVVALIPNQSKSTDLHLFFDLERRYDEFRRVSDGHSSRGSLTTKLLADLMTVLPPLPVVKAFDTLVEPMVQKNTTSLREIETLAALRDTLLP